MNDIAYKNNVELKRVHKEYPLPKKQILKRGQISLGEKALIVTALVILSIVAFQIISTQAAIYNINKEIINRNDKVIEQKKENSDLKVQVKDLSRYERILQRAKEKGLKLDGDNVRVVSGK